ncbi:MAG: SCO family protein [Burkholderiaceae bacterium]
MVLPSSNRRLVLGSVAALCAALTGCKSSELSFNSTDITGASFARDFKLTDHEGNSRQLSDFAGKVLVVFFGFTFCPDICPTTLAQMKAVRESLSPEEQERMQVVFITVDPERDTAEVLSNYVPAFDPSFVGLHGTVDEIKAAASEFKVFFAKVPGRTEGSYTMDHTAASYVFDKKGQVRLMVRHNAMTEAITSDIKQLL